MPVDFDVRLTKGWKRKENSRVGAVQELTFYDTKTGKVQYRFTPTLDQWNRMALAIKHGKELDVLHKSIMDRFKGEELTFINEVLEKYVELYKEADNINKLKGKVQCL